MPGSRKPIATATSSNTTTTPPRTPGTLGIADQADPSMSTLVGDTPNSIGIGDGAAPASCSADPVYDEIEEACFQPVPPPSDDDWQPFDSGAIPVGAGMPSVVRIPVPGTGTPRLYLSFSPRGWTPASGSTSTVFIQDVTGKRHLRLDYGYNKTTGTVDYHWNQKGTQAKFGITNHTPAGTGGKALYKGAKYFKYAGRGLLVVGAALDIYSIVVAKKKIRQVAKVVGGWAAAAAGCKVVGELGAGGGTLVTPGLGTAVGGAAGCVAGGIGGYVFGSWLGGEAYDYVEEIVFEDVPEVSAPE